VSDPAPARHRIVTAADGSPVLVKRATQDAGRTRLRAEATLLKALAHPGTVRAVAQVDDDDATELHLAWVGPHSLATVTGLPADAAARLVAEVAGTVADLHRVGVVHRRLTPDHVLLGPDGHPVLTGFGDALSVDRASTADDVAALGQLLTRLVHPLDDRAAMVPERRRGWHRDDGLRGTLLTVADHAQADDPSSRPTAAQLSATLRATVPRSRRGRRRSRSPRHVETARVVTPPPAEGTSPRRVADSTPPLDRARHAEQGSAASGPSTPDQAGASPTPSRRAVFAVLAACVITVAAAAAWIVPTSSSPDDDGAVPTTTAPAARRPDSPRVEAETSPPQPRVTAPSTAPAPAPAPAPATDGRCPAVRGEALADVDGDGCPDAIAIDGERVTVGPTSWVVGRPGDVLVVADWDCDTVATAAVLRPDTGEVFVFDRWAGADDELTVAPTATISGASDVRAVDADGDGCSRLTVDRTDGPAVAVPTRGAA